MADRVPSDHPSVPTVRATLGRAGATDRPRIEIPTSATDRFPVDEVVRFVLDGRTRYARIERHLTRDRLVVGGVYDAPRFARDPGDADNRLPAWVEGSDATTGGSVLVDVIEEGFLYGLRAPGERQVYDAPGTPDDSLASIARDTEERS